MGPADRTDPHAGPLYVASKVIGYRLEVSLGGQIEGIMSSRGEAEGSVGH